MRKTDTKNREDRIRSIVLNLNKARETVSRYRKQHIKLISWSNLDKNKCFLQQNET